LTEIGKKLKSQKVILGERKSNKSQYKPACKYSRLFVWRSFRSTVFPDFSASTNRRSSWVLDFRGLPFFDPLAGTLELEGFPVVESAVACLGLPHTISL